MHKNAMDVCIKVTAEYQPTHDMYMVDWVNLGYTGAPWHVGHDDVITIDKPEDWQKITTAIFRPRKVSGLP